MASKSFEDLDLSQEEIKRIQEALKDEKFRKMFVEYAEEISNPENRKKYEEEIAMLENERGMDVQFVNPQPGFVLKTSVDSSEGTHKAFINICISDKIAKPNSKKHTNNEGKNGLYWQIPHSFSPPREDVDKSKKNCTVYDVVFHPDTMRMTNNPKFKKLVEDTAIEGIEKQFDCKLDRNNIRRPKITFKGQPVATVIRSRKEDSSEETGKNQKKDPNDPLNSMPYPYGNKTSEELSKEKMEETAKRAQVKKSKEDKTKSNIERKEENGFTTPKYTIIHRSNLELQEFTDAPDSKPTTRPKELAISIELPLCRSAAGVDLDIFEDKLVLKSEKPAYMLDLKLPYVVDDENGSAKFDKTRKCLIVTLPVVPAEIPKMPSFFDEASPDTSNDANILPLIEELPPLQDMNSIETSPDDLPSLEEMEESSTADNNLTKKVAKPHAKISYNLPKFDFSQDKETVTFVFYVKNISEDSVSKAFPSPGSCCISFISIGSGGFPMHYALLVKFDEDVKFVPEHSSCDISDSNMTVTLLKGREFRSLWNTFSAGVDESSLEKKLFLTSENLSLELEELTSDGEKMGQTDEQTATDHETSVKVTEMNPKKLTINIRKASSSISEEDEEDLSDDNCPSSADIEVVHSKVTPNLHGILKQRSMSESSEDHSSISSGESPTSMSPRDSDGIKRSVKFNSHIDKTTFKTNASVNSMKQALKSKRRRNRKKEEKNQKAIQRRRHNSNGSECSSCDDDHDVRHSSESHSEDDPELTEKIGKTGIKVETCGIIQEVIEAEEKNDSVQSSKIESVCDEVNKISGEKEIFSVSGNEKGGKASKLVSDVKSKLTGKQRAAMGDDSDDDLDDDDRTTTVSEEGVMILDENTQKDVDRTSCENGEMANVAENDLINVEVQSMSTDCTGNTGDRKAAKATSGDTTKSGTQSAIKGNSPESNKQEKSVKSKGVKAESKVSEKGGGDNGETGKGDNQSLEKSNVETELSWNERDRNNPKNEHRTDCAFKFSNAVMFDLDID